MPRSSGLRARWPPATSSHWRPSSSARVTGDARATAARMLEKALPPTDSDWTEDKAAAYVTGLAALREGKLDEARRELTRAVSLSGHEYAIYRLGLAEANRASAAFPEALANAKQARAPLDPKAPRLDSRSTASGPYSRRRGLRRRCARRRRRGRGHPIPRGLGPCRSRSRGSPRRRGSPRARGDISGGRLDRPPAGRRRRVDHAVPVEVELNAREQYSSRVWSRMTRSPDSSL